MKLTDLDPKWFDVGGNNSNKDGLSFLCPCPKCQIGSPVRLAVQFANPIGDYPAIEMTAKERNRHVLELKTFDVPPGTMWRREGETFETISLSPSVDASQAGHWHGNITNGEVA